MKTYFVKKRVKRFKASLLGTAVFFISSFSLLTIGLPSYASNRSIEEEQETCDHRPEIAKDRRHPLTHEGWKGVKISSRLEEIERVVSQLKTIIQNAEAQKDGAYIDQWVLLSQSYENLIKSNEELEKYKKLTEFEALRKALTIDKLPNDFRTLFCENLRGEMKSSSLFLEKMIVEGKSGNGVAKFSHQDDSRFSFIVKSFDSVEDGLKELLDSLLSYRFNPCPSALKMARIIDAIILPSQEEEALLKLMIEGVNSKDIHAFLGTDKAASVMKASAAYLSQFHLAHKDAFTSKKKRDLYFAHEAEAHSKLRDNPLDQEGVQLLHRAGKQEKVEGSLNAGNIIKLLSSEQQKAFQNAVLWRRYYFEKNCKNIHDCLNSNAPDQQIYFLTKTHGDAHGHNFFYDDTPQEGVEETSTHRVSMIDYSSLCRTYKNVGDPAEDIGRFLGSLWDWASQTYKQNPDKASSAFPQVQDILEKVGALEALFLETYLEGLKKTFSFCDQETFKKIFENNTELYKLRFFKALFNNKSNPREQKMLLLESWLQSKKTQRISCQEFFPILAPEERKYTSVTTESVEKNRLPFRVKNFIENRSFNSEESDLTRIWKRLRPDNQEETPNSLTLFGMGGAGKTTLALQYVHEALQSKAYHRIYWISSEREEDVEREYATLQRELEQKLSIEGQEKLSQLQKDADKAQKTIVEKARFIEENKPHDEKWLLVYDNVPDPKTFDEKILKGPNIHALMTSRCNNNKNTLNLEGFKTEASLKYFSNILEIKNFKVHEGLQEALQSLAEKRLGNLPLALSHAASYIKRQWGGQNYEELKGLIEDYGGNFDPFNPKEPNYEEIIGKTFNLAEGKIPDLARKILNFCVFFPFDRINEHFFIYGLKEEKTKESLKALFNYDLIKRKNNNISIHPFIYDIIKKKINNEIRFNFIHILINILNLINPDNITQECTAEQIHKLGQKEQKKDPALAVALYRKAVVLGHKDALQILNTMYKNNNGIEIDHLNLDILLNLKLEKCFPNKFLRCYEKNAEKGFAKTQYILGNLYRENLNFIQAVKWLRKAAEQGHEEAQFNLGVAYDQGQGVEKNYLEAFKWFERAAEQGKRTAQFNLGVAYAQGKGVEKNSIQAVKWYKKAAEQGHVGAQFNLGVVYDQGQGVEKNYVEAVEWYKKAAEQGHVGAQFNLGVSYYNGWGVEEDFTRAFKWYKKAAEQGDRTARLWLFIKPLMWLHHWEIKILKKCFILPFKCCKEFTSQIITWVNFNLIKNHDQEEAAKKEFKWFKKAAEEGDVDAQFRLGTMYIKGKGTKKSAEQAKKWFEESSKNQYGIEFINKNPHHEKRCVIDIGSSGIRLGLFNSDFSTQTILKTLFNEKRRILLRSSLKQGTLPLETLERTINLMNELLFQAKVSPLESSDTFAFATAWARSLNDKEEVLQKIKDGTGLDIHIIDQEEEGKIGFNALLIGLRSFFSDTQSFLYQTREGKELLHNISDIANPSFLKSKAVVNWDIGGGSMQFAQQNEKNSINVIGSTDSSTIFANTVIQEIKRGNPSQGTTPYPLSKEESDAVIDLAIQKAEALMTEYFLKRIKSGEVVVFGAGQLHHSNRDYVNRLLGINEEIFYRKSDLEKATQLLINKNNSEIASALGIKESDARNRFTSMLLVLGFMTYLDLEKIYTLDIFSMTGALFREKNN